MRTDFLLALAIFILLFSKESFSDGRNGNNFTYELSTTRTEFFEGETIPLFMRVKNNSNYVDSIYSLGRFKIRHNLYIINENGDSISGYQVSSDDKHIYAVFQPDQTIEFCMNDLTKFIPMSGGLFYTHIPAGKYKVRGYIPNGNTVIKSNDLTLNIIENVGEAKKEFEVIKKLVKIYNEEFVKRIISYENFADSVFNLYLNQYQNGKFFTKTVAGFRNSMLLVDYRMDSYVDLNLNAIKNADISDSSHVRLITRALNNFLGNHNEKFAYTQNDLKYFILYNTEINPIIREQLIFELEGR